MPSNEYPPHLSLSCSVRISELKNNSRWVLYGHACPDYFQVLAMMPLWILAFLQSALELCFWSCTPHLSRDVVLYPAIGGTADETLALSGFLGSEEISDVTVLPIGPLTAPALQLVW